MIHGVYANKKSFHPVEFTTGLNVILADRSDESAQKDTRNGLGKTTLIEIIDFCLGSDGKRLRIDPLEDWSFTLDISIAGNRVRVTRAIKAFKRIIIEGSTDGWIVHPEVDEETGERLFNPIKWRFFLGWSLFGLPVQNSMHKYNSTYRSLISYFIRTGSDAYNNPFRHFRQQKTWDQQLNVAYLLGLNWEYADKWQVLKDQAEAINAINKAVKTGAISGAVGTVGELETERVHLERQVQQERDALKSFKVHPQYEAIQEDADKISVAIHELTNQNVIDRRRLNRYVESITQEAPPSYLSLEKLYEEVGLIFPDAVTSTLEEAKEFHQGIISNRKVFLETEINRLEHSIIDRNNKISELTNQRSISLNILVSHHALQEFTQLQEKHIETRETLERVKSKIAELKEMSTRKREIKGAQTELVKVAERDHEQRRDIWSEAVNFFDENSRALYKSPGRLIIDITDTGYKYDVEIERSSSQGIGKMKIFCFDLMLLQLSEKRPGDIDFLIHDSILYDGVDSRQRALALEHAAEVTQKRQFQYICALNSDMVPKSDFSENFEFEKFVRLTLTDKEPKDRLLGIQF